MPGRMGVIKAFDRNGVADGASNGVAIWGRDGPIRGPGVCIALQGDKWLAFVWPTGPESGNKSAMGPQENPMKGDDLPPGRVAVMCPDEDTDAVDICKPVAGDDWKRAENPKAWE